MDFYEDCYQRYTNLSHTLIDQGAQRAAISIAAYLTTGRDIVSMYHKGLSQTRELQGEAAKTYQDFVRQIERRFSPLVYVGDYCSFCGALSTGQLQTFLKDTLESITAYIREEEQVVDAYHTSLEAKTDEEILSMCWKVDFIAPVMDPAVNRQTLLSVKSQVLHHLYESKSMLEQSRTSIQVPQPSFKIGARFCLSEEGLENHGEEHRGKIHIS
jgi:hypothetical protein